MSIQDQLNQLKTAYGSGARTVAYDGKTVTYNSPEEMRAAIAYLENQISGPPKSNTVLVRSRKGW
jgi:hypothetical protein